MEESPLPAPPVGGAAAAATTSSSSSSPSSSSSSSVPAPAPRQPSPPPARLPRAPTPSDFVLLRVIGRGAFGKVLQVAHRGSGRVYALKVYSKRFLAQSGQLEYTVTERTVMTRLTHPYIVALRYAFQTPDRLFLISDYCAGGELFLTLRKQGLVREEAARVYLGQVVLALEHMHAQGVLHRDLKPENILLDGEGHIKLTDYGLAKDFLAPGAAVAAAAAAAATAAATLAAAAAAATAAATAAAAAVAATPAATAAAAAVAATPAAATPAAAPAAARAAATAAPGARKSFARP